MAFAAQIRIGASNWPPAADDGSYNWKSHTPISQKTARRPFRAIRSRSASSTDRKMILKDYFDEVQVLICSSSGGVSPPRWFSPLECRLQLEDSPLLLYLPGIDGVGLGLILQHQKLGKLFDIWCLHIPVTDRTPFQDLVKLVEETVKSENQRLNGRPIYLVGESFGACLAIAVAARNPDLDIVLILANPGTSYCNSPLRNLLPVLEHVPAQLSASLPWVVSLISGESFKVAEHLQPIALELSQGLALLSSYHSVLAKMLPKETLLWKLQMMKSASSYANSRLHVCQAQTLVIASGRDQLLPSVKEAERIFKSLPKHEIRIYSDSGKMPRCEIRIFNDANHFLFMDPNIDLASIIKGTCFYRHSKYYDYVHDYIPPTQSEFHSISKGYRWIDAVTDPVMLSTMDDGKIVRGLGGIPEEGPVLFVGYHMLLGIEIYPLVIKFFEERNVVLRGMAHPMIFVKLNEGSTETSIFDAHRLMGAVPVSPSNLYKLLSSKSYVLLYPGGMREALHHKGEEYQLFWPDRSEFVRMAAIFGAKIVPFGVVGEDDVCQLAVDYKDQMKIPFLRNLNQAAALQNVRLRTDMEGEVANQNGYLPGVLPKLPGRFYYLFGKPFDTTGIKNEVSDREKAQEMYIQVKSEVERCISYLKKKRESDPYRSIIARLLYQASQGSESEVPTFEI
ncbi:hypothetical protein V2J09_015792 [Rumex salicifolius]